MKRVVWIVLLMLGMATGGMAGCADKRGEPAAKSNAPPAMRSKAPPAMTTERARPARAAALDESKKWDCLKDADCENSCSQGAVSKAWYKKHQGKFPECDDGCNNQISGPPRCIEKQCVAFDNKGMQRSYCTRKKARRR